MRGGEHTRCIASPRTKTSVWSETVRGDVRKKKARVMWKRLRERMMVLPLMRAMMRSARWSLISEGGCR